VKSATQGLVAAACLPLITGISFADETTVDGQEVLEAFGTSQAEIRRLEAGEVVNFDASEFENSKRELATDATVLVNQPLPVVLTKLTSSASLVPSRKILASGDLDGDEGDFSGVSFDDSEKDNKEVDRLFKAKPGSDFNFSKEEWEWVKGFLKDVDRSDQAAKREAAAKALQHILRGRYKAYRAAGIDGIAPVQRGSKKFIDVGNDLRLTTETHEPMAQWFPEYYNVLMNYPEGADCCEHIYRWMKVKIAKRPTFALTHSIIEKTDDSLLYTERLYYLNNAGNYGQVLLGWVPYGEGTYMGLAMSANTGVLDTLLGKMLRSLGRDMAGDLIGEVLLDIKTDLESGEDMGEIGE